MCQVAAVRDATAEAFLSTPLPRPSPPHPPRRLADYGAACASLKLVGERIRDFGLPPEHAPLVVGIPGKGNVSRGVQHALSQLGDDVVQMVEPHELEGLSKLAGTRGDHLFKVFGCVIPLDYQVQSIGATSHTPVDRNEYYAYPDNFQPVFHELVAPHLTMLATTMYWDRRYPKLLTNDQLAAIRAGGNERLLAVADITCDIDGAVEALTRSTSVEDPFFLYDVEARREGPRGVDGNGVLMMGVDILPAELPREASEHFGQALLPFIEGMVQSDPTAPYAQQVVGAGGHMPPELWSATITANGKLTPNFEYIAAMRSANERQTGQTTEAPTSDPLLLQGSTVLALKGDLFDFGIINTVLDAVEAAGAHFAIVETSVTPLQPSTVLLQLTVERGREALDEVSAVRPRLQ